MTASTLRRNPLKRLWRMFFKLLILWFAICAVWTATVFVNGYFLKHTEQKTAFVADCVARGGEDRVETSLLGSTAICSKGARRDNIFAYQPELEFQHATLVVLGQFVDRLTLNTFDIETRLRELADIG